MSDPSFIVSLFDLATRPVLVPIYVAAARLSVAVVRRRRLRLGIERAPDDGKAEQPFPSPGPGAPVELPEWPAISIVVPVLNGAAVIGRCLKSIRALDYPSDRLEVIVADNGSTDRTAEVARRYGVNVVMQPKRGAAAARNEGIGAARGDWIAFTDADCIVHPLWLKHLASAAPKTGCPAFGGRIVSLCRDPVIRDFLAHERVFDQQASLEGRLLPFPFINTANALFRRDALAAIGGFDEDFPAAAAEDVDLGWRLSERRVAFAYAPDAWVGHCERERGVDIYGQFYRYGLNEVRLYWKHRDRFRADELSKHFWIRPLLYRHFWKAVWRWAIARASHSRRFWRLVILKELGHMAGKIEGSRQWPTLRYFRLWTHE